MSVKHGSISINNAAITGATIHIVHGGNIL